MRRRVKFLTAFLAVSLVITTTAFWFSERFQNPSVEDLFDVMWWWITTSFTVGYGDIIPLTAVGKIAATIAIITGIYLYTNFITISAESIHELLEKNKFGKARATCKRHIVICEYTAFADELIQEIDRYPFLAGKSLVIVSDLIGINPYPQCHFIRGVPINPEYLKMANIQEADFVFVFANARYQEPDFKTMHIVSRIRKFNKTAKLYIELNDPGSELANYIDDNVVIMDSKNMIRSVLKNQSLSLQSFEAKQNCIY